MANDLEFHIGGEFADLKADLDKSAATIKAWAKQVGAEVDKATRPRDAKGRFLPTGAEGEIASIRRSVQGLDGDFKGLLSNIKSLAVGFAGLAAVGVFGRLVAQGVEFNAQLESAELGIASVVAAQAKLVDSSGKAVDGAEALAVAIGMSKEQMFQLRVAGLETAATTSQLVEAFQQAVGPGLAAGLGLDQIRQVTIQLVQAASAIGVPMDQLGQEVRSILEGSIDVNSRVAKTLGISNEMVKNWKEQGKLAEELGKRMSAFTEAGKLAADTFAVVKSNAAEAAESLLGIVTSGFIDQLKNGLKDATAGIFDTKTLGVKDEFQEAIKLAQELTTNVGEFLADGIRGTVALVREFNDWLKDNRKQVDELLGAFGLIVDAVGDLLGFIARITVGVTEAGVKTSLLARTFETIALLVAGVQDGVRLIGSVALTAGALLVKALVTPIASFLELLGKAASLAGLAVGDTLTTAAAQIRAVADKGVDASLDIMKPLLDGTGAVATTAARMADLKKKADEAAKSTAKAVNPPTPGSSGRITGVKNPAAPAKLAGAADAGDQAAAQQKLIKDATDRATRALQALYEDGLISATQFYNARTSVAIDAVDREIAAEKKARDAAKPGTKDRLKAETEIKLLEGKRGDLEIEGARATAQAKKAIDKDLEQVRIQSLELQGKAEEAARAKLQLQYEDLLKKLKADGNQAGIDLVNNLINTEASRAKFNELKAQADRIIEEMRSKTQQAADATTTGAISPELGAQQQADARKQAIEQLTVLQGKMAELAASTNDPTIIEGARQIGESLRDMAMQGATGVDLAMQNLRANLAELQKNFASMAADAAVDSMTQLFTDIATGSKSAGDALKDFVLGFVQSMAQIAARALATYLVLQMLDAVYPGLGRAVSVGMGASSSVKHTGGVVGEGGAVRQVNPMVFAGAPRYHSGGVVGLAPDEQPAILKKGEEVLTADDPRHRNNGGGQGQGGGNGYRIINAIDPNLLSDHIESASGERAVLNVIGRNPSRVKQLIG